MIKPIALLTFLAAGFAGCQNAGEGAVTGAGIGAVTGLAVGSLTGAAGAGAAFGAETGAIMGGVEGGDNAKREKAAEAGAQSYGAVGQPVPTIAWSDLAKFVGTWRFIGWIQDPSTGTKTDIFGQMRGEVEHNYFVRLSLVNFKDPRTGQPVTGSTVFGFEPGRGFTMTSAFSTSPATLHFLGSVDGTGSFYTFNQVAPTDPSSRSVTIVFASPNQYTAEVRELRGGSQVTIEYQTFTRE